MSQSPPPPRRTGVSADLPRARRFAALLYRFEAKRRHVAQREAVNAATQRLLWLLSDGRARSLREIATELQLEQSTVNRQVNTAVREGHVLRERDGGPYRFTTTAQGSAAVEAGVNSLVADYEDALAVMGEDVEPFLDLLDRFVAGYGPDGP